MMGQGHVCSGGDGLDGTHGCGEECGFVVVVVFILGFGVFVCGLVFLVVVFQGFFDSSSPQEKNSVYSARLGWDFYFVF